MPRRQSCACAALLVLCFSILPSTDAAADLIWEDQFSDEQAVNTGDSVSAGGANISFTTTVFSDSDGGTFDLVAERSANFFSFESGTTGNHSGFLEMTFNNENDDPADYLELTMNFGPAGVTDLRFSMLDIDGSPSFNWDDAVEVFFNGTNVKTDPSLYTIGPIVFLDNESYMDGFEAGNASAGANQTTGNVDFDFGSQTINSVVIRYFTTDDAIADPSSQFVGVSDMFYTANSVPEPSGLVVVALAGLAACLWTRRVRRI